MRGRRKEKAKREKRKVSHSEENISLQKYFFQYINLREETQDPQLHGIKIEKQMHIDRLMILSKHTLSNTIYII